MVLHGDEPPALYISRDDHDATDGDGGDDFSSPVPIFDIGILSCSEEPSTKEYEEELLKLNSALHTWGCFQAIEHGISSSFLDEIRKVARSKEAPVLATNPNFFQFILKLLFCPSIWLVKQFGYNYANILDQL
ncbi:hypothetical protein ACSBR2_023541 [Camellia fascicularis]